jgi:hypothetical protein
MLEYTIGLFSIFGNLALVLTVLLVLRELRENIRQTRVAHAHSLVELASPLYLALAQDRPLAELFLQGAIGFDALDAVDRRRYRWLLVWWLIFYENLYYQRRHRLLERHAFQPWWRDLQRFVVEHNLAHHWKDLEELFQEEFAREVRRLIARGAAPVEDPTPSG